MGTSLTAMTMVVTLGVILMSVPAYVLFVPMESTVDGYESVTYSVGDREITADIHTGHLTMPTIRGQTFFTMYRFAEPDGCITDLAEKIRSETGLDGYDLVAFVHSFVRSIDYVSDRESQGAWDHWSTPCETLVNGYGDCEDHAILFVSICMALGFECVIVMEPGHVASGVLVEAEGDVVEYDGKTYLYCDPTASNRPGKLLSNDYWVLPLGWCWMQSAILLICSAAVVYLVVAWGLMVRESRDEPSEDMS